MAAASLSVSVYLASASRTDPLRMADSALTDKQEDRVLVERSQEGDCAAFDTLVIKYSPRLYSLIYHMTSHREDTHDLLQEVFARAFRNLRSFRGQSGFYTWIYTIAVNLTLNFLKRRNRRHLISLDDMDSGVQHDMEFLELTATSDPVRETGLRELQRHLNEALQKLSEDHRAVVTMFDIQGMPHAEISRILSVSEGTVRSRLHYAHKQLQSLLADYLS